MRLLLSLILTSLSFLTPHKSRATIAMGKEQVLITARSLFEAGAADCSDYGNQAATIFHKSNIRNSSNQHRLLPGISHDYSGWFLAPIEILPSASRLEEPYSHCIPIGMKLLFQKHYFW